MWDDFNNPYLVDNKYTSVLMAIIEKVGRVKKEGNESLSWKGNCTKIEVLEINLNYSVNTPKAKWEKSIERVKEGNWVLYSDSSKNDGEKVGSGWVSYRERI